MFACIRAYELPGEAVYEWAEAEEGDSGEGEREEGGEGVNNRLFWLRVGVVVGVSCMCVRVSTGLWSGSWSMCHSKR